MKLTFQKGVRDGLPICFGYLSVAFAFGIFAVNSGLASWQALLMSMTNVTSAGQLAAVTTITSAGSLLELALSQLVINLRYALMSVSLSQKLDTTMTMPHRLLFGFVHTDEVFAVAMSQPGTVGRPYLYGLILTPYLGWATGTLIGAVAGDILPAVVTASLGIAIYGMFVAIVVPDAGKDSAIAVCSLIAVGISCLFRYLPGLNQVSSGFAVIISAVAASAVMAWLRPIKTKTEDEP